MNTSVLVDRLLMDRPTLSLAERVEARRQIDRAAGIRYPPPTADGMRQLARLTADGLRRP